MSAKSLAEGQGYRLESLPGEPSQTKYPPLYPLLLSLAWRIDPHFPQNLSTAAWLSWLALPPVLIQLKALYPRLGFSPGRTWILVVLFGLNPYVTLFSTELLSEMLFLAFALGTMLLLENPKRAALAGVLAGLAYLTRTAGIVLLLAGFLYLWIRKERRAAILFGAVMCPFIAAWVLWMRVHQLHTTDPVMMYYLDYLGYRIYSFSWQDLHLFLWKNIDGLLWGLGALVVPKVTDSFLLKILAQVIAVAMISGIVRIVRQGRAKLYVMFAAGTACILLLWHFPPDERFLLPLFPLALAGLLVEFEHAAGLLRVGLHHPDASQRRAAGLLSVVGCAITLCALAIQIYVAAIHMPEDARRHRQDKADHLAAHDWVRANVPASANFYTALDPTFYLYTGHHATGRPLAPVLWYREDHAGILDLRSNLTDFAREHGIQYYYLADADLGQGVTDEDRNAAENAIRSSPELKQIYRSGTITIFRFTQ